MQILFLDPAPTLIVDIVTWLIFHLGIGYWCSQMPLERFNPDRRFYQSFHWEKGGKVYQELFRVRAWKRFIPQGSKLYRGAFSLQELPCMDLPYLERWLKESIRAEFCHWMMMVPSLFFFLWNNPVMGWVMVAYAVFSNFFPIVAQRFNRPRIRHFLETARKTAGMHGYSYTSGSRHTDSVSLASESATMLDLRKT